MSMFSRSVKLQFNKMKYADLKSCNPNSSRIVVKAWEVMVARTYFFTLGFLSMAGLLYFDINTYKLMKGIVRWRHRVEAFFGAHHEHGHEYGLIGLEDDHGHDHGHRHGGKKVAHGDAVQEKSHH